MGRRLFLHQLSFLSGVTSDHLEGGHNQLWTYLQVMETRVKRLEEFIMKGYDWDRMLADGSLQETIKDDVEFGFYVNTTSELKRNI